MFVIFLDSNAIDMQMKLEQAFEKFDNYNRKDPHVFLWEGISYPQEYFLALQLHKWVQKLDTNASESLLLASRSQHIGRWEKPRERYPNDRVGYLTWRKDLGQYHAKLACQILKDLGYTQDVIDKTETIILKKGIKSNPDVQTIENALCLVFLQFQYEDFHPKHDEGKMVNILKKSLLKMDSNGHTHALNLPYSSQGLYYVQEALKQLG